MDVSPTERRLVAASLEDLIDPRIRRRLRRNRLLRNIALGILWGMLVAAWVSVGESR